MWYGSVLKVAETHAIVSHTGVNTMIGGAAKAIQEAGDLWLPSSIQELL